MKSKKIICIITAIALILSFLFVIGSSAEDTPLVDEIKVNLNDEYISFDQPPIMLVPLRAIFEAIGANVEWDGDTKTVTAVKGDTTIILQIGSNILIKNGENISLDVPAQIVNDRTMVSARAVAESFGATVEWDESSRTVLITYGGVVGVWNLTGAEAGGIFLDSEMMAMFGEMIFAFKAEGVISFNVAGETTDDATYVEYADKIDIYYANGEIVMTFTKDGDKLVVDEQGVKLIFTRY